MNRKLNRIQETFKLLVLPGLILFCQSASGQSTKVNSDSLNIKNLREEIYVQTDRDIYITGEQVWLKVFKLNRLNSSPDNISKVVYIELLDNTGNIEKQLKITADGFSASGSFRLPDTLKTGNYLLRAYTGWMMNSSENLFFYKYISVINPFLNLERLINKTSDIEIDSVKVLPEGGSFIAGLLTRAGVKSTSPDGKPVKAEGSIVNSKGDMLTRFQTDSAGFGTISLTPHENDILYVQFMSAGGSERKQVLQEILKSGSTFSAERSADNSSLAVKIFNRGTSGNDVMNGKLEAWSSGLITYRKIINSGNDTIFDIPMRDLPSGSSKFVLSRYDGKPVAERWIYNGKKARIDLGIILPVKEYGTRQRVSVDITEGGMSGTSTFCDLTVAVVKKCLTTDDGIDITNREEYSALPGEWYSGLSDKEMNDRLLTYNEQKLSSTTSVVLPEMGGELISGVLKGKQNHEPLILTDISLAFVGKTAKCQFLKTDSAGEFNFVVNRQGVSEIVIQPLKPVPSGYYVEFDQPFCTTFNDHVPPVFNLDSTRTEELNKAIISMQVSKIYDPFREVKEKKTNNQADHDFYGKPDKTINLADFIELTTIREALKEIVPDIIVIKRNKEYFFKLVNLPFSLGENNPLILMDGVPVYDLGKLLDVSSREIEKIDILNSKYYYTNYIFDGIVNFVTKKGNLSAMEYDNSVFRQVFEGCQLPQEFYSPDYSTASKGTYRIPDFRNTLYWNPGLYTDNRGKASVTFFTSDEPGTYLITVEGITPDGKTGICRVPFTVK